MNAKSVLSALFPLKLFNWPYRPAAFDASGLALVLCELPENLNRADARLFARKVLRELCAQLLDTTELTETPRGPVCKAGYISLSYAGNKLLIGLSRHVKLGVDITASQTPLEVDALTRLYLPESDRNIPFSLAWAQMEACSKLLDLPLTEISEQRSREFTRCKFINCQQPEHFCIAVAIVSSEHLYKTVDSMCC